MPAESAESALDYLKEKTPGRDLHGSPDAGHGRPAGRARDQGPARARRDPDHDVHVPGGRDIQRPGARLGRRRRAAEIDPPHRRHQGAVPAPASAGSPHRRAFRARGGRTDCRHAKARHRRRRAHAQPIEALLKEQNLELRRFVVSTLDAWTHRIVAEVAPERPGRHRRGGGRGRAPTALEDLALGRRHRLGSRRARGRRTSLLAGAQSRPNRPSAPSRRSRPRTRR